MMDLRTLIDPSARVSGAKPLMLHCPWHDDKHKSLAVYSDHLHCYGCQKHMSLAEWVADKERLDIKRDYRKILDILGNRIPPTPRKERTKVSFLKPEIAYKYHQQLGTKRQWFHERGLTDETIGAQLLGYSGNAFTIPVWHPSGLLLSIRFRRDDNKSLSGPKYWGIEGHNDTMLYNQVALRRAGTVVICEGELDCLRIWQEGIPAVSSTNGANGMTSIWDWVGKYFPCRFFLIAFDQDTEGLRAAHKLKELIDGKVKHSPPRARILRWNPKLGKDITELANTQGIGFVKGIIEKEQMRLEANWARHSRHPEF